MTKTKPDWDTAKEGPHPAFSPVTDEEIATARRVQEEAQLLAGSVGRGEADEKQKWLADAMHRERFNRANLELARKTKNRAAIFPYRYALALALRDLGQFSEAIALITTPKGRALKGFENLRKEVEWYRLAVYRDDAHECGCERKVETVVDPALRSTEVEIELKRRHRVGFVYSTKHGEVVDVWRCSGCGCLNAHNLGPPENQAAIHEARAHLENPHIKVSDRQLAQFADHVLLKKV